MIRPRVICKKRNMATQTSERKKEMLRAVTEEAKKYIIKTKSIVSSKIEAILLPVKNK
jgi:hypothetical protein